jgi:dihydroorotate dehydrogenase
VTPCGAGTVPACTPSPPEALLYRALRPILFRLDPERAHQLALAGLAACEFLLAHARIAPRPWTHPRVQQRLWDISFPNPVGLAAGFDKDGRAPHVWPLLGFGFAELGTVTADAQEGNPPPRLFRLAADRALINRLGFNNAGANAVAQRLERLRRALPPTIPLGINLGKSRRVPLEAAPEDYRRSLQQVFPLASYIVVNVSSPNTPGLRDLQAETQLARLVATLRAESTILAQRQGTTPRPLLIKVAPDLPDDAFAGIVRVAREEGASGFVATNTTIGRRGVHTPTSEGGGLSGAPLRDRATDVIRLLRRLAGSGLPIIGVGGIFSATDAYAKIRAGASLVELYTAMIYEGPRLAHRIARGLVDLLQRDGLPLTEAVGLDA